MNQYYPVLLTEYIWLLIGRALFGVVVALFGCEMLLRVCPAPPGALRFSQSADVERCV